ncbi:MAG TPA: nuclear transport factor 2 family protein [Acidimicrobiales bacterium]|nr:nuclear transport factor 2 family protein [Acidimicrobiales bacterium]
MPPPSPGPRAVVGAFWRALYARDWEAVAGSFSADAIYYDVPVGPAAAARGPASIVARLRLGLDTLAGYDHRPGLVVAEGNMVVTEHEETWRWAEGASVTLPFVSLQRVTGGRIVLWKDYWDQATLMDAAPPSWHDRLEHADLSWVFDATGVA